jgi:hypothetical protein
VCQTTGGCTGNESQCQCRLQTTFTCQSGSCSVDSQMTVSCGFCMQICPEL